MKRILATIVIVLLVGCSPVSGSVTDKDHRQAYWYYVPSGKILVPMVMPECWRIWIGSNYRCVSKERWDTIQIGDSWEDGK